MTQFLAQCRANRALIGVVIGVAALLCVIFTLDARPGFRHPGPQGGVADFSDWDFTQQGNVSLAGEWRYHDYKWAREVKDSGLGQPAAMPGAWPIVDAVTGHARASGYGTYTVTLKLPETAKREPLGIETGYWLSAYAVYANGELIYRSGTPAATEAGELPLAYSQVVQIPNDVETVDLRVEVSNHLNRFGGTFVAPTAGTLRALTAHSDFIELTSMFLVGAMMFAAIYHFVAFALDRSASVNVWFGLFATLLSLRTFTIEPLAGHAAKLIGQDWTWRIDFAATIVLLPICYRFFHLSFPQQISSRLQPWISGFCIGAAGFATLNGPVTGEFAVKVFEVLALASLVYLFAAILRAATLRIQGALLVFTGWSLASGAIVHDILLNNGFVSGINLIPFAFIAFFLCLSGMLAGRFRDAFRKAEQLTFDMRNQNERLELAVQDRTTQLQSKLEEISRNRDELELARAQAVSANIAKSKFLATMSHELRTPLNSILGFSELIRDQRLGSISDERYLEYAAHINDSGAHLLNLIGDILDLSKIEAGRMELRPEPVDLMELARIGINRAATRERGGADAVRLSGVGEGGYYLMADRRLVLQMLINLLSNALKFTPTDGRVELHVFQRADQGLSISVRDTGCGMDMNDVPKALEAFSQIDDGLSRAHEGTGLGLPIVKSFVELHGGSIHIESARGQGTKVTLNFPASRTIIEAAHKSAAN